MMTETVEISVKTLRLAHDSVQRDKIRHYKEIAKIRQNGGRTAATGNALARHEAAVAELTTATAEIAMLLR
jgi:hypothetical protein